MSEPAFWVMAGRNWLQLVDLVTGETTAPSFWQLSQHAVEDNLDDVDRRPRDRGVIHFAFGGDARIAESIDRFIAERSDNFPGVTVVNHGQLTKSEAQRVLQAADPADELLYAVRFHSIPSIAADPAASHP